MREEPEHAFGACFALHKVRQRGKEDKKEEHKLGSNQA